jgi:hypothetical protein
LRRAIAAAISWRLRSAAQYQYPDMPGPPQLKRQISWVVTRQGMPDRLMKAFGPAGPSFPSAMDRSGRPVFEWPLGRNFGL